MPFRTELLQEFRAAYDRMEAARAAACEMGGEEAASVRRHAECNFQACAEALARRVPVIVAAEPVAVPESWQVRLAQRGG